VALAMLTRLGIHAEAVPEGHRALAAIAANRYDVVLMDLHMPGLSGIETARRIATDETLSEQPRVIAVSASVFDADRAACREAGMHGFIAKPIAAADLERAVLGESRTDPPEQEASSVARALAQLRELERADQPGFVVGLCRDFVRDSRARVARIAESLSSRACHAIERDAHTLKSSSAMLGATRLSHVAGVLEEAGRAGDLTNAARLLEDLGAELAAVVPILERATSPRQDATPAHSAEDRSSEG
jgi:CheY-like chemotaxis protein